MGKKNNLVYLIDLGLAKRFTNPKNGDHIPFKDQKGLTGTARYASLNAQKGYEQSRRDDLEAVGLIFVYFLNNGRLPWMGINCANKKDKN